VEEGAANGAAVRRLEVEGEQDAGFGFFSSITVPAGLAHKAFEAAQMAGRDVAATPLKQTAQLLL